MPFGNHSTVQYSTEHPTPNTPQHDKIPPAKPIKEPGPPARPPAAPYNIIKHTPTRYNTTRTTHRGYRTILVQYCTAASIVQSQLRHRSTDPACLSHRHVQYTFARNRQSCRCAPRHSHGPGHQRRRIYSGFPSLARSRPSGSPADWIRASDGEELGPSASIIRRVGIAHEA